MTRRAAVAGCLVAAVAAASAGVLVLTARDDGDALDRAREVLRDEAAFDTADEAGSSLARVTRLLLDDARACAAPGSGDEPSRCTAISSAAATTQVFAVHVLGCTAPGRHDVRVGLGDYLEAIDQAIDRGPTAPRPAAPALPEC